MDIRIWGACLILAGCGGTGLMAAAAYARQVRYLEQFTSCLQFMRADLQYSRVPLPELCRRTAAGNEKGVGAFFLYLARELEDQISPNVEFCVNAATLKTEGLPQCVRELIFQMGKTLGRFDAEGQLESLLYIITLCQQKLSSLNHNQSQKLRSFRILGLCAGAAMVILFV